MVSGISMQRNVERLQKDAVFALREASESCIMNKRRRKEGNAVTGETMKLRPLGEGSETASEILTHVYMALQAKGYDPITQLVGFVLTGDPTYITSFNGARSMICRLERDEILEELVRFYVENKLEAR